MTTIPIETPEKEEKQEIEVGKAVTTLPEIEVIGPNSMCHIVLGNTSDITLCGSVGGWWLELLVALKHTKNQKCTQCGKLRCPECWAIAVREKT